MYDITEEQIAAASGIDKSNFESNMAVIKQLVREEAVKYREAHNGQEPSLNWLIQAGVNTVVTDKGGYSQAQMRAAGILRITVDNNGYAYVTDIYHNTYYIDKWDIERILTNETTLPAVVEAAANSSSDDSNSEDNDDGSAIDTISNAASEVREAVSDAAEAANESITEHVEANSAYAEGNGTDENGEPIDPAEPGNIVGI